VLLYYKQSFEKINKGNPDLDEWIRSLFVMATATKFAIPKTPAEQVL
jgi:hypothetical protein